MSKFKDLTKEEKAYWIKKAKELAAELGEPTYVVRDADTGELSIVAESQLQKVTVH